jgi:glycosyltransferase involved in cell wall biosynthesis
MKLVVISSAFPPMAAGEADHVFHLCRRLAERGLEVHVITTRTNKVAGPLPFKVHSVIRNWSWPDLFRLAWLLRRLSPDAVILKYIGWIYNDHPMITFAATVSKSLKRSAVFVTQFANAEGAPPEKMTYFTKLIRDMIARKAGLACLDDHYGTLLRDSDRLIFYSDLHRMNIASRFVPVNSKSLLIPPPPIMLMSPENHGSSRRKGREKLGVQPDEFLFAYFGYVYPEKGVETLLHAFQIVVRNNPRARLLILGGFIARDFPNSSAYREEILALPKQLGIADKVIWFGGYDWDSDEASVLLRAADAGVIPMDYGVQLNNSAFAGAVAHGLPVITTRGCVLEPQFVHGENAFLCPPRNPEAMAEGIQQLMNDSELLRRLKAGAVEFAENWFCWDKAVARTVGALTSEVDLFEAKGCDATRFTEGSPT